MNARMKAFLIILSIFLLGSAVGIAIAPLFRDQRIRPSHQRGERPSFTEILTKELDLSPEQQAQLSEILAETRKKHDEIRKMTGELDAKVREEFRTKFAIILTEQQKLKFKELNERFDQSKKKKTNDFRERNEKK